MTITPTPSLKFNLKQFREERNIAQGDLVAKLGYSQAFISRIERGRKPVSDQLLIAIEDAYKINLDAYKKYDRNKHGAYLDNIYLQHDEPPAHLLSAHLGNLELRDQYLKLLQEKYDLDQRFFALSEERIASMALLQENNRLLQKIVDGTEQLLSRMDRLEQQKS